MAKYKVYVCLEAEYDDIEANNEDEAFIIASDSAMQCGDWQWDVTQLEDEEHETD